MSLEIGMAGRNRGGGVQNETNTNETNKRTGTQWDRYTATVIAPSLLSLIANLPSSILKLVIKSCIKSIKRVTTGCNFL